ncbi:helix-turn-helix transcriptional regulator [Pseudomonas sp. 148P]|uniref:Helix-turn-helix transcriptional regulator n=1 Tax=Pseudomonas ulcerans TaxID=3115852 RepID=A0ABU7HL63_9PSED|nr:MULTISPECIES: helix-turn-helix transcriptional regulator [unclassified Pseudomonas]MEE1920853.1 helix-turn-helix transcriptional regulator [Pseudomonas sp. 147P]MEE1932246.1 helix-turn-helix transcriptional regulator [Pseudomonas sp. 148P]
MRKFFLLNFALMESHPQNRAMNIGAAIRKVRLEKGLTLEAVALDAGTYAGNLSKIERSQQLPSLELLHKLSQALGAKMSDLYAVAESESDGREQAAPDQSNEVILVRRNFQALNPKNRKLAIEFLKLLGQSQGET